MQETDVVPSWKAEHDETLVVEAQNCGSTRPAKLNDLRKAAELCGFELAPLGTASQLRAFIAQLEQELAQAKEDARVANEANNRNVRLLESASSAVGRLKDERDELIAKVAQLESRVEVYSSPTVLIGDFNTWEKLIEECITALGKHPPGHAEGVMGWYRDRAVKAEEKLAKLKAWVNSAPRAYGNEYKTMWSYHMCAEAAKQLVGYQPFRVAVPFIELTKEVEEVLNV